MTLSSCSRDVCACVWDFCAHPAWWICVPLLVGLAGADWVRDPESRILCGRAFIVALRNNSSGSFVGLIRQDTKTRTRCCAHILYVWMCSALSKLPLQQSFISLVQSGQYYLFIVNCWMAAHAGGANLIKTTRAKHCWWIERLLFTLLVEAREKEKKTQIVNRVNAGKQISQPGPAFNLISILITKLGLWNCVHVCKCEAKRF